MYYDIDLNTINSKLIGYTDFTDYWCLDKRTINECELIFMQKGSVEITMLDHTYVLEAGNYLFIEPGVIHEGKAITAGGFFYVHLECKLKQVYESYIVDKINHLNHKLKGHIEENNFYVLPDKFDTISIWSTMKIKKSCIKISNLFNEALSYRNELTINSILFIDLRIKEIFLLIQGEMPIALMMNEVYYSTGQINPYIKEAIIYLNNNIKRKIIASDVSNSIGITHQYLNKLFKRILGCTMVDYINRRKIKIAKEMIEANTLTFKEISYEIGLDNQYYFSRLFKKEEGMTPSEYRYKCSSKSNE